MTGETTLRKSLDGKAKPLRSLGRLEDLAVRLALLQDTPHPTITDPVALVFAADHGAVASGISAFPSAVTAAMVRAYLAGTAAVNRLAATAGARVLVVDAGVAADLPPHPALLPRKIAGGTADWTHGPAMSRPQAETALQHGADIVDTLADAGCTLIALGEMGIGNTASAALLAHKAAALPLEIGPGAGLDPVGVAYKRALAETAASRTPTPLPPIDALTHYGGFEIAMLTGAILRAAERGTAILIDGLIVTAAALLAHALDPTCLRACIFAHRSAEPGHAAMLHHLGADPLLDLGLRLGEASGAVLAIPLLRAAVALFDMADLADVT